MKKLALLGLPAAAALAWWLWPAAAPPAHQAGGHATVKRGQFPITIVEQGTFAARQSMELRIAPEAYMGQLTIVFKDADTIREEWTSFAGGKAGNSVAFELKRKKG